MLQFCVASTGLVVVMMLVVALVVTVMMGGLRYNAMYPNPDSSWGRPWYRAGCIS